jgi:uncharacterized membrane protein
MISEMLSRRAKRYLTVDGMLLVSVAAGVVLATDGESALGIASGFLLVWFAPGVALMSLLRPYRLLSVKTVMFSIVASYAIDVVVGVGLEVLGVGLDDVGFIAGLWLVTCMLLMLSLVADGMRARERRFGEALGGRRCFVDGGNRVERRKRAERSYYPVYGLLLLALVATILWTVPMILRGAKAESEPFTALSVESAPVEGGVAGFSVVIDNQEGRSMVYRLEMRRDDVILRNWDGISLGQHERWVQGVGTDQLIGGTSFWLFVGDDIQPYRHIHLMSGQSVRDGS